MTNDQAATDDNGHRLTAEEIEMMTDQFNFNAFVAAEIAKVETGPTHKFDVACRIQEASNHLRLNACKADRLSLAEKEMEIQRLKELCYKGSMTLQSILTEELDIADKEALDTINELSVAASKGSDK